MNQIMTHIVAGYPSMKKCEQLAEAMLEAGVSFLEIQIPFSDPVADGPTIMHANQQALDAGVTPEDCFQLMERLNKKTDTPLLFMTYFNIPFRYGLERFCKRAQAVGCYGLIIPDMPIDEEDQEHYLRLCQEYDLNAIQVVSPITPVERLKRIADAAAGFVYCVSRTGTTGGQWSMNTDLSRYLKRVKQYVQTPLAVGFGISSRAHVETALQEGDIAVIGSKVIKLLNEGKNERSIKHWIEGLL